jgi:hypothetical protein
VDNNASLKRCLLAEVYLVFNQANFFSHFLTHVPLTSMTVMFTSETTAALFTIALVSSIIVVIGSSADPAFAVTKKIKQQHGNYLKIPFSGLLDLSDEDKSVSQKSHSEDADQRMNVWKDICNT